MKALVLGPDHYAEQVAVHISYDLRIQAEARPEVDWSDPALEEYGVICLAGYMQRVPDEATERHIVLGFHPSLLPKYRGGSAVKWQLRNGEKRSGCTIYRLKPGKLDAGPIIDQAHTAVLAEDTPGTLYRELQAISHTLWWRAVLGYATGTQVEQEQDEAEATWHPRLPKGA